MSNKTDPIKEMNIISAGSIVEGKIKNQGSIRIDGKLIGDVVASESIAIGLSGEIEGNVSAKNVTVGGRIKGTINASEKIVFESKSVVKADIRAARLVIDEGSIFDGKVTMAEKNPNSEAKH